MWRSGLIFAIVMLLLGAGLSVISPLCVPCLSIFLGLAAGYLAGVFDKPVDNGSAAKSGAIAGAIGGVGAIAGQITGGVINSVMGNPAQYRQMFEQLGVPYDEATFWIGRIGGVCCSGIFDILLMVGLGALGGIVWWQLSGKNTSNPPAVIS